MLNLNDIVNHSGLIYQPLPFEEYKNIKAERKDCEERYLTIKQNYGSFIDKTLVDICCSNGYFLFRFMQDGGKLARGIEIRREIVNFINLLSIEKNIDISCNHHLNGLTNQKFDVGIYLDTHFAIGTEAYLDWLSKHVKTLFTSCTHKNSTQDIANMNHEYKELLQKLFNLVSPIYTGFMGRIIYKCE